VKTNWPKNGVKTNWPINGVDEPEEHLKDADTAQLKTTISQFGGRQMQ